MNQGTKLILPMALLASGIAFAQETDERVTALESEVALLKSANQSSALDRLKFNGFYSFGVTKANNNAGFAGATEDYSFDELTLIGLQGEFALADSTSVVAQLVARGSNDFNVDMEWAYLKHTFSNDITARVGKLRTPLYMYSDYLDVGFAQHWLRPADEVYGQVPFNSYVGGDIAYDIEFSESVISLQAFAGTASSTTTDLAVALDVNGQPLLLTPEGENTFDNMWGTSIAWNYDSLTLRAVYGSTYATSTHSLVGDMLNNVSEDGAKGTFVGAGLQYDNGDFLVISEYAKTEVEGEYADIDSYYLTAGYRFGDLMPYATYAYGETTDNQERAGTANSLLLDGQRSTYSVGIRYELLANLAIKADVSYATNFDGTAGFNTSNIDINSGSIIEEDTMVYSIRLDGVF